MANKPVELPGQMPSSFDNAEQYHEKPLQKVVRRLKEEPLVPLGIGLTVFAFTNAYRALRRGDSQQANRMFRARIAAQGFTVVAMVAGSMYYQKDREKTKELRKLQDEKDAEEKRHRWIRELEIRDEEDKILKEKLQKKIAARHADAAGETAKAKAKAGAKSDGKEEEKGDNKESPDGGFLSSMGLWGRGQKKAEEDAAAATEAVEQQESTDRAEKKTRKENPRSSLGAIGEAMKKKDD